MAVYQYKAAMKSGQVVNNRIEGTSIQEVKEKLKANGLTPITVRQARGGIMSRFMPRQRAKKNQVSSAAVTKLAKEKLIEQQRKKQQQGLNRDISIDLSFLARITYKDIVSFTQSLFLLKRANFTNTRALTTLLENTENPKMKSIIEDLLNGVEAGEYIYATLEYYTDVFPQIYVSIIKIGETSGNLTNALEQALDYIIESNTTKKAVKKALTGPLLQAGGMLLLTIVGVLVGVPVLENLYDSMGVKDKIPPATVAVANRACAQRWYLVVAFIIAAIFLFNLWRSTVNGRYRWDMFKLKMPIFGGLITRLALQKFFKAMQLNIATNAKLQDALEVSKGVVSNYVILSIIESPPTYPPELNINHKTIKLEEKLSLKIIPYLKECIDFIEQSDKIYVHCSCGLSRSPAIVIGYLMWKTHNNFEQVYNYIQKRRPRVELTIGFVGQLKKFEKLLKNNNYNLNTIDFNSIKIK